MEYFNIKYDNRYDSEVKSSFNKSMDKLNEMAVVKSDYSENTALADMYIVNHLHASYHLLSDKFRELLENYSDDIEYIPIFLSNVERESIVVYWSVKMLVKDGEVNLQNQNIEFIEVNEEINEHIFKMVNGKSEYLFFSLVLLENVLRLGLQGILYEKVDVKIKDVIK